MAGSLVSGGKSATASLCARIASRPCSAHPARPSGLKRTNALAQAGPVARDTSLSAAATEQVSTSSAAEPTVPLPTPAFESIAREFASAADGKARYRLLLEYAKQLPPLPEKDRTPVNRVMGCTAQAWMTAQLDDAGRVVLRGGSDSELTAGLCAILVKGLSGLTPEQLMQVEPSALGALGLGPAVLAPSRANGFRNLLETARKRTRMLTADLPRFPSLRIERGAIVPQGRFAEAQAEFLEPDPRSVEQLAGLLAQKRIGVVAHFYMDPQVQGVLSAAREQWPHIQISDSLVMADKAVRMAEEGCTAIAVLGVDFMSENVRAILDEAGHTDVQVYRMAAADIGCSLAEAAESERYEGYLSEASATPTSMHVVYINTSLRTKARAHALVPTITCTSSNVVQTVLQGFAQIPGLTVWYGPDTYMGRNLAQLFTQLASLPDEAVAELHPGHTAASVRALLPRLRYFEEGTCIVHHLFGGETTELVAQGYGDAYLTAHFEVPGEMFTLAMAAKARGMGTVGSTQNILDFIAAKLETALQQPFPDTLQVVLGTESGMITSIVRKVQSMLRTAGRDDVAVEVVFPVAPDAITTAATAPGTVQLPGGLAVVPGPAGGEGCSSEGGCASCPYMKMNSLSALLSVCSKVGTPAEALLEAYKPKKYAERIGDRTLAQAGCEPILHMRGFQKTGRLPEALVADITTRNA